MACHHCGLGIPRFALDMPQASSLEEAFGEFAGFGQAGEIAWLTFYKYLLKALFVA